MSFCLSLSGLSALNSSFLFLAFSSFIDIFVTGFAFCLEIATFILVLCTELSLGAVGDLVVLLGACFWWFGLYGVPVCIFWVFHEFGCFSCFGDCMCSCILGVFSFGALLCLRASSFVCAIVLLLFCLFAITSGFRYPVILSWFVVFVFSVLVWVVVFVFLLLVLGVVSVLCDFVDLIRAIVSTWLNVLGLPVFGICVCILLLVRLVW